MHEFIAIEIVSCFPSFEANLCLRNNQDGYRSKSVTAMGDLIIWKLSLLYSLSRVVHRVVQRKQFTFVSRVQNLCENAVSWQRQSADREMGLFRDAQEKTAMDSLQSARRHINFLTVNFP